MDNGQQTVDIGAETLTNVLPNEILLSIFRFLPYKDLINAEQVCCGWKTVTETCFATEKQLNISLMSDDYSKKLERMKRYGHSIRTIVLQWYNYGADAQSDWAQVIADRFPNLSTMELRDIQITNDSFRYLSKCSQLKNVSLDTCNFTDEGLRCFLQALPGIKSLTIYIFDDVGWPPSCCSEPIPRFNNWLRQADASTVFSTCPSLHTFAVGGAFDCTDPVSFSRFCKECVTLRKLVINDRFMPQEMFVQIQHCTLLEELTLKKCDDVDDLALSLISQGCPNLRTVSLFNLPKTSDQGLKCFARCRNLSIFKTVNEKMTDETLFELSQCVNLRQVILWACPLVSDRGCAALLAHCPRLELLDVEHCKGISNVTVDSGNAAVECRDNRLRLQLNISDTSVTPQSYVNCHPLLRVNDERY